MNNGETNLVNLDKLDLILLEIKQMNEKMDRIEKLSKERHEQLQSLKATVERMDGHIDFVEDTYDKLKFPIDVIKRKIEYMFGGERKEEIKKIIYKKEE